MEKSRLFQVLRKYPELEAQFGEEWFLRNLSKKGENRHVLIKLLLQEEPEAKYVNRLFDDLSKSLKRGKIKDFISRDLQISKLLYFSKFLQNLETDLKKLKGVKGFGRMIEKLRESDCDEFSCIVRKFSLLLWRVA